jgi:hypothetical protein
MLSKFKPIEMLETVILDVVMDQQRFPFSTHINRRGTINSVAPMFSEGTRHVDSIQTGNTTSFDSGNFSGQMARRCGGVGCLY